MLELIKQWSSELASRLENNGVRVEEIILFGSYARGDYSDSSDLDLVIVSEDWGRIPYTDRLTLLYRIWDKPIDGNFIPLTREELRERLENSVVLRDASRYWITVYKS